jgi:hypothetical protein
MSEGIQRAGSGAKRKKIRLQPEAPLAHLIASGGAQKVDLAKRRPMHVRKVELTIRALPEQEAGKANFPAGSNNQINVTAARYVP